MDRLPFLPKAVEAVWLLPSQTAEASSQEAYRLYRWGRTSGNESEVVLMKTKQGFTFCLTSWKCQGVYIFRLDLRLREGNKDPGCISSRCHNKYHRLDGLNNEIILSPFWWLGRLRARSGRVHFLTRLQMWLLAVSSHREQAASGSRPCSEFKSSREL